MTSTPFPPCSLKSDASRIRTPRSIKEELVLQTPTKSILLIVLLPIIFVHSRSQSRMELFPAMRDEVTFFDEFSDAPFVMDEICFKQNLISFTNSSILSCKHGLEHTQSS